MGGEAFVIQWSVIPAQIVSGHQWITILAAMFMHASWFGKAGVGGSTPAHCPQADLAKPVLPKKPVSNIKRHNFPERGLRTLSPSRPNVDGRPQPVIPSTAPPL